MRNAHVCEMLQHLLEARRRKAGRSSGPQQPYQRCTLHPEPRLRRIRSLAMGSPRCSVLAPTSAFVPRMATRGRVPREAMRQSDGNICTTGGCSMTMLLIRLLRRLLVALQTLRLRSGSKIPIGPIWPGIALSASPAQRSKAAVKPALISTRTPGKRPLFE